jgi:hypothetical protein
VVHGGRVFFRRLLELSITLKNKHDKIILSMEAKKGIFYQELINKLCESNCGLRVNNMSYNVLCYADDLLLCSLSVTGLQEMIKVANRFITDHGLSFNPNKTECCIFGNCTLSPDPKWYLNNIQLKNNDSIQYLGVSLSHVNQSLHSQNRINACRRAFYSLQGAGLCNYQLDADTTSYLWKSAVKPVLLYGLNTINISKRCMDDLEKAQSKLVKSAMGLHKYCRSSPLLKALQICSVEDSIDSSCLGLVKSIFHDNSRARNFYIHLIDMQLSGNLDKHCNLITRVHKICGKHNVNFMKYVFDKTYCEETRRDMKYKLYDVNDGYADSVRQLLLSYDPYDKFILNMMLSPF